MILKIIFAALCLVFLIRTLHYSWEYSRNDWWKLVDFFGFILTGTMVAIALFGDPPPKKLEKYEPVKEQLYRLK